MNDEDFRFYQRLLLENSGLSLTPDKTYLLTTRLEPVAKSLGLRGLPDLTALLRAGADGRNTALVVQAMTTRETSFFRDMTPFMRLKMHIFPALLKRNARTKVIHIWSAGCSTGQEPYSIAMAVREFFRAHPGWSVHIVATDISEDALNHARDGLYSEFDIQRGLSMKLMLEHFRMEGVKWRANDDLRRLIRFAPFNLLQPMGVLGKFDVIFCRNVLIYFDTETKKTVLDRLTERLYPEGYLILGACEAAIGLSTKLQQSAEMPGVLVIAPVGKK
jgi:chemotaxis protein methyltransferase CheR